jgi:hypothetical protein
MKEQHIDDIANERTNEEPDYYVSRACRLIRVRHHKIQAMSSHQAQTTQPDEGQDTLTFLVRHKQRAFWYEIQGI